MMNLGAVDGLMLGILLFSVGIGVWRGFLYEFMSLAGWVIAYWVSQLGALRLAPYIPIGSEESNLRVGASMLVGFVLTLLLWMLVSKWTRGVVHKTVLHSADRILGGLFGAVRALVFLLVVVTLVGMTPLIDYNAWQQSQGRAWVANLIQVIKPWVPAEVAIRLP
jgi:membrane protein required for colicin V production